MKGLEPITLGNYNKHKIYRYKQMSQKLILVLKSAFWVDENKTKKALSSCKQTVCMAPRLSLWAPRKPRKEMSRVRHPMTMSTMAVEKVPKKPVKSVNLTWAMTDRTMMTTPTSCKSKIMYVVIRLRHVIWFLKMFCTLGLQTIT